MQHSNFLSQLSLFLNDKKYIYLYDDQENSYELFLIKEEFENLSLIEGKIGFWASIFDHHYKRSAETQTEADFDVGVWKSSYTGEDISKGEMKEWVDSTINSLKKLVLPTSKVLEIGVGSGLILSRLLPLVESYVATDTSREALNLIKLNNRIDHSKLTTIETDALNINKSLNEKFDLVILNSVVQYFPDLSYFYDFLDNIKSLLSEEAIIFLGDVRNNDFNNYFYTETLLSRSNPSWTIKKLKDRIQLQIKNESETLYSPSFFYNLNKYFPWIQCSEVLCREGVHDNEMNSYRYNVTLKMLCENDVNDSEVVKLDWVGDKLSVEKLDVLYRDDIKNILIKNVPNKRLHKAKEALKLVSNSNNDDDVSNIQSQYKNLENDEIDFNDLVCFYKTKKMNVDVSWGQEGDGTSLCLNIYRYNKANVNYNLTKPLTTQINKSCSDEYKKIVNTARDEINKKIELHHCRSVNLISRNTFNILIKGNIK